MGRRASARSGRRVASCSRRTRRHRRSSGCRDRRSTPATWGSCFRWTTSRRRSRRWSWSVSTATDQDLEGLLEYLRDSRGFDFTGYKRSTLTRRIQKRMEQVHVDSFATSLDHLQVDPDEFTALFNCILINVTSFFRDEPIWTFLRDDIIPRMLEHKGDATLRVWVAGCASGEEAYSISMLLAEAMGRKAFPART